MIHITIPGEPVAKGRPRLGKWGTYTPEKTQGYEILVKMCYMEQAKGQKLEGELEAIIDAFFAIPKSASKKKSMLMENGDLRPIKKPDVDNVAKIILDSLNKLAYEDDSQVVGLLVNKYYSSNPRVEFSVLEREDFYMKLKVTCVERDNEYFYEIDGREVDPREIINRSKCTDCMSRDCPECGYEGEEE